MDVEIIKNFFNRELNVALKVEWLTEVMTYLRSLGYDSSSLLSAVYEQWLHTDLKISTKPFLSLSARKNSAQRMLGGNTVVQINSVVDIGTSMYSTYRNLTRKFEDNSGFQQKLEESETNCDLNSRRMLSLEITDGRESMKAVEYSLLNALSLLTCPGCKVLLKNNICLRRGILLLTELNCVVLGGDDELLMKTGRPLEIMMRHLNIGVSSQKQCFISLTKTIKEINQNVVSASSVFSQPNVKPVMQVKPLSGKNLPLEASKRKLKYGTETTHVEQLVNNVKQRINVSLDVSPTTSGNKMSVTASTSMCSRDPSSYAALTKRIKMEVAEDDTDVILLQTPTTMKQKISGEDTPRKVNSYLIPKPIDDPIIVAYKRLRVESIAAALHAMQYAVGPRHKLLAAFMATKPLQPLHINSDGLWALSVTLSDESYEDLTLLVSHKFLVELIGWTPEEALDARASKDLARRKEGTLRTRSAGQSMRRLDLIWEVEFFPLGGSTPIIHGVDTYAQKFGLVR